MKLNEMSVERLQETLGALRAAVRYRNPETKRRHFCHLPEYRAAFIRGIKERRELLRRQKAAK